MKRLLSTCLMVALCLAAYTQRQIKPSKHGKTPTELIQVSSPKPISKTDRFVINLKTNSALTNRQNHKINSNADHSNTINPNIPLSDNGKLLSPDGHEVDFRHPTNKEVAAYCWTPTPFVNGEAKDAGCPFTVSCDNPANRDVSSFSSIKYIELAWHVMWSGGASSNIDQTRIDALMTELNADFAAYNVIFCADPANFYEDAANYNHDENTEEVSLKTTYNVTPTQVVNIYVVGSMGPGGYARFPYDPMGGTSSTGGIVLNRGNCNVGTHTLAHEMGHTFGLEHTFAGVDERTSCSSCYEKVRNVNGSSNTSGTATVLGGPYLDEGDREGDWCSDTHPHDTYTYQCSTSSNPNGGCDAFAWANAPVDNHMSYSFCSTTFTDQQWRRMHCMMDSYLGSWTANGGGVCGTLPPVADFTGTPTSWVSPALVNFTDLSAPPAIIDSVEWIFDVAASGSVTCAGCTGTNARWTQDLSAVGTLSTPPTVTYTNIGLYSVSLTVYSTNGNSTETKTDYIEVITTGSDCDTQDAAWNDIGPSPSYYSGGFGYFTGVPSEGSNLPIDPAGYYQQYFTPNPGTSVVGSVVVGLGLLIDPDDDMTFQVVVYEDDGLGLPDFVSGPVAVQAYSPTQVGVPGGASYTILTIPLSCAPTIAGATFHVGVEMFPGDATDELVLVTNADGEGGSPLTNSYSTTFCGDGDYNVAGMLCGYAAVDFDLLCYPTMGWYAPAPYASGYTENVRCDTTDVTISTGTLYDGSGCAAPSGPNPGILNWSYTFASDGATINSTTAVTSIPRTYTSAGPDTLTITAINDCGRADTTAWIIPYNFLTTPDADFTKDLANPVCLTAQPITFTANTSGYSDYSWDFGDGTTLTGTNSSPTHSYAAIGTYYVSLTVTSPGYQPSDTTFLEDFEAGIPGTWTTRDNNGSVGNAAAIFDGTNATAWVDIDLDGAGDQEAWSTGWNNPITTPSDDWLISPNIAIAAGNSLAWDGESFYSGFPDAYEVYVVGGGASSVANCLSGQLVYSTGGENAFTTQHVVDLPSYGFTGGNIKVCFRNNSGGDQGYLAIDNVRVGTTGPGCLNTEQKLDFVEVVDCSVTLPTADGDADVTSGCSPLTVTFTDITTPTAPDPNAPTSWVWNFGDGTFSTAQHPGAHVYSSPGTYLVIFEACNAGGCSSENITITVAGIAEDASYSYSSTTECVSGTDMAATITGTLGGTFTAIPAAGISLNASSGLIDVSASTSGTYDVTYTTSTGPCAATNTITVTINPDQDASFSYSSTSYCEGGADPTPTITGTTGGTFSFAPAGLSLNTSTGAIDVSASTPGAYTITYTTAGPCAASSGVALTVVADEDAAYSYTSTTECQSGTDMTANITGTTGGTFSSAPAGLSINTSTGLIDVSSSTAGTYDVTYTTPGSCSAASIISVTIDPDEDPAFTLSSANECQSGADVTATITGTAGGSFSSTPAGLSLNTATGAIDVSASSPGAYTVTYTTPGTCSASSNQAITIVAVEDATYSYSSTTECQSGTDITATITGTAGGTFSSTPAGLSLNAATGAIDVSASTAGTYDVTYTTPGSCSAASIISVTIDPDEDPAFTLSSANECQSGTDVTATITGTAGGTFSATPAGLSLNTATGAIDVSASAPGAYTVTYTTPGTCSASSNQAITIVAVEDATYSYSSTTECQSGTDITATITGTAGGTFSSTPAGLSLNAATGAIDVSASTAGTYDVTYTTPGSCSAASIISVTIDPDEDPAFTLSSANECQSGADVTATITGTAGGSFSSTPAGLSLNTATGAIDVSASSPGAYTVTYTTPGTCSASSNQAITIVAVEDAAYSYSSTTECQSGTDITATITGTAGGTFSSTPAGLSLNAATGAIDVSASTAGTYDVTYTTPGSCSAASIISVTVNADDDPSYSYSAGTFCVTGADPLPTITGTSGGTFSATGGLTIDPSTGLIDLDVPGVGAYTVTYTTTGVCPASADASINITTAPDATFSYTGSPYCENAGTASVTFGAGASGGTFSAAPAGLTLNASTGDIDLNTSTPGTYTVDNDIAASGGCAAANASTSVTIDPADDGTYTLSSSAECQNGTDITATITGTAGGTFTSAPAGLSINASTGAIDVSASSPGTYTVTYTTAGTCSDFLDLVVTITIDEDATYSYSSTTECQSGTDITATITGTTGGTFSASPAGLSINASTGAIDVSASTAGTYDVTYTTPGSCSAASIISVTVNADDDPSYSYSAGTFCVTGADPLPTITGTSGGTFSATGGLTIDPSTGLIDLDVPGVGAYTVTYTTTGVCPASADASINITTAPDATFSYTGSPYCENAGTASVTFGAGASGGTFSAAPAGLTLNASTGDIDLNTSTPGTYTVDNDIAASGGCAAANASTSVTIDPADDGTYTLSSSAECQNGTDITATITGTAGGTFTSAPAGLSINASTGAIDVSASSPGTYTVTYTTAGTCSDFLDLVVTITIDEDATYSYSSTTECQSGTDITATITGTTGGTFSASPAGLSINASTGAIDVSASTAGTYDVTYTTPGSCSAASIISVTVNADDDPSYSYSAGTFCVTGADPLPTITGTSGGTFSATGGLTIDPSTGLIDLDVPGVGAYTVTYTTTGVCPASADASINITTAPDATFSYTGSPYCENAGTASVTFGAGASGGTFSAAPAGLTLNASTGDIDLNTSTPGTYTVDNDIVASGGCAAANASTSVTIDPLDDAGFSYSSTNYCQSDANQTPSINTPGGSFVMAPLGSINSSTGEIDISATATGSYIVTYTTASACPNSSTASVTINADDTAAFSYASVNYCSSDPDPSPTITGTLGGTFTSVPAGLSINGTTGDINLATSTSGTYTVTYTTLGLCPDFMDFVVTIDPDDDPAFSYTSSSYCQADLDQTPTITGTAGGTFTSSPAGISLDGTTGQIDLSASSIGTYSISYTTSGACPATSTFSVSVTAVDDPSFSYGAADYCTGSGNTVPIVTGTTGGTFSGIPTGSGIDPSTGLIDLASALPGAYTITYSTSGACADSSTQTLNINSPPDIDIMTDTTVCGSYTLPVITGSNLSGSESYYDGPGGTGTAYSSGDVLTATTLLYVYDINGICWDEDSLSIQIDTPPTTASAGNDTTICDDVLSFTLGGNTPVSGTGMWSVVSGTGIFSNAMDPGTDVSGLSFGTNEYMWMITNGICPLSMDHIILTIETCEPPPAFFIPSGFTPGGNDNTNETWVIEGISVYPDCEVFIYNKWGSEVFASQGYPDAWDGTYNGNPLPVGAYYYIIKLNDGTEPYKGTVTIIK